MADAVAVGKEIIPGGRGFLLLPRPSLGKRGQCANLDKITHPEDAIPRPLPGTAASRAADWLIR